jgi:pyridoxal phosphate enzyme (YggS family)
MGQEFTAADIRVQLAEVQRRIALACEQAGRAPRDVTLVAVSKTHSASTVMGALRAGQVDFGENRPEEAIGKIAAVAEHLQPGETAPRWHMIGHVQSRKARYVVQRFVLVHSVDTLKLAHKLSHLCEERGCTQDILLEINVSGEESKGGWAAAGWERSATVRESLWSDIQSMLALPGIRLCGLMTMAPIVEDPEQTRPVFAGLRHLREALREAFPQSGWPELSMGMTDDYPVAIAEGATLVRIGRAIFGRRVAG